MDLTFDECAVYHSSRDDGRKDDAGARAYTTSLSVLESRKRADAMGPGGNSVMGAKRAIDDFRMSTVSRGYDNWERPHEG